jgi:hypothetical protein
MNDGGAGSSRNNIDSYSTTAKYDIKAGEELLQDYTEFIDLDHEVAWFDHLRERVFGKYSYTQQGAPSTLRSQPKIETVFIGSNTEFQDLKDDASHTAGTIITNRQQYGIALFLFLVLLKSSQGVSKFWSSIHRDH